MGYSFLLRPSQKAPAAKHFQAWGCTTTNQPTYLNY